MNHELSIYKMKHHIYDSILSDINTTDIQIFVKDNKIPFTENVNGIFVNLSTLNDDLIRNLYSQIILLQKNTSEKNLNTIDFDKEFILTQNEINFINNDKKSTPKISSKTSSKNIKKYKFTSLQKKILELSLK